MANVNEKLYEQKKAQLAQALEATVEKKKIKPKTRNLDDDSSEDDEEEGQLI